MRTLVLGGTGVFGGRLCRLLANDPLIDLTIGARDGARVEALAAELGAAGLVLDWRRDLDRVLAGRSFDVVIHVAGPFQGQDYAVAEACIRHGVHYLDLSDDRAFVCGIVRLDAAAKAADVLVCAGASTAPALTGAVLERALQEGMAVDRMSFGIVPGNDAPRGRALVEAILASAGNPIPDQPGRRVWGSLRRFVVPGLGARWAAACDLPEPTLFRERFGVAETYAGAGLELSALHFGLWLLAWPVRLGLLKTLRPAATPLAWIADRLRALGSDKGGLRIDLAGPGASRCWSLIAEGGDGPYVPAMPAAALVRRLARGDLGRRGAMPCVGLLSLADIESEWLRAHLRIASGWGEDGASFRPSLYRRVLGRNYGGMSEPGQRLHDGVGGTWSGRCSVDGPANLLGRIVAKLFALPPAVRDAPIEVDFKVREGRETWIRRVGGRSMRSEQSIGRRRPAGWLVEHFGPFAFDLRVTVTEARLELAMAGMRFAGIPLPRLCWPHVSAVETGEAGRFHFDVEIGLPGIGRLVRYRGSLTDR
ncbi:DUF4166 domain-containing protein [Reyranella aquatilis]|uniref:DUF4166 domain-containing protein n=1 Tax=Reyranella aquatilis TaxID=2035356 RepID=A0ABS8L3N2_9HYPH|nr:SDR family oxidoreductase [Reyranella aquatilis]MCC8432956.1 DUF4166 domain-containing protein [Reyranella aquatilis]